MADLRGRPLSDIERRVLASGQHWRCTLCSELLPAYFEVDHIFALGNAKYLLGSKAVLKQALNQTANLQVLCPLCHRGKNQRDNFPHIYEERTNCSKYFAPGPVNLAFAHRLLEAKRSRA